MRKFLVMLLCVAVSACAAWAANDKDPKAAVEARILAGLKAYKDGKTQEAVAALQEAVALMQASQQQGLAALFPKAPDGWEAGKIESQSMSLGGSDQQSGAYTSLSRTYTRKADNVEATITLLDSKQMIEAQRQLVETYKNPAMLAMLNQDPDKKTTLIDQQGWIGWKIVSKGQSAEAMAFNQSYLLTVRVSAGDEPVLDGFWKAIDFRAIVPAAKPAQ